MPFWKRKKPWEKVWCVFTVEESSKGGGWVAITEPAGEYPTIEAAMEFFEPGHHYRVMARAIEKGAGYKEGDSVGVVWQHYDPLLGRISAVKEKPKPRAERKPSDPSKVIDNWLKRVQVQMAPIKTFSAVMDDINAAFAAIRGHPAGGAGPPAAGQEFTISPLEYEGKAPWIFHPQIVKTVTNELKGLINLVADRIEGIMGTGFTPQLEEEEEFMLPSLLEEEPEEEEEEFMLSSFIEEEPVEE